MSVMATVATAGVPLDAKNEVSCPVLSPPNSVEALKLDSDSELSDLDEPTESTPITPAYIDGTVPVFEPSMEQFADFQTYMKGVNPYGMQWGIVKVIPPPEWKSELPKYDELIKPIKVKDAIRQEILGTQGKFRQLNHVSQRSYNVPQWRTLCEQSDHQPPAKRGERRANQTTTRAPARPAAKPKKKASERRQSKNDGNKDDNDERLPTPGDSDDDKVEKNTSVSARRKYNRKEAATRIDHEAFKGFDYELHEEFPRERCDELERAYWKTLTYASPLYGADHVGTLFDDRTKIWNLDKLPNLLDVLGEKIPGVNTAYLYMGMWKATFAWHLEDVDLYSINYLHFGAPKQWYSISQKDARRFEDAMRSYWPDDAKACDQFLRHKTFLISPSTLLDKHHIKVNKITHHPGEFVITFPYGYHSGYNLGYNCAEAVNFALDSWLPYGRIAKKCDCSDAQDSVFIDVAHLERKINGEPTPAPSEDEFESDDEDEEGDTEPADMHTPPESGGEIRIKIRKPNPKRKRAAKDSAAKGTAKKIRINLTRSDTCALCPHYLPHEALLETDGGKKVHKKCAELIPETIIEVQGEKEVILGFEDIPKGRFDLKCVYCGLKKGACFQCTHGKCTRAFHGVCASPAGVHLDEGEIPVYGDDGTEYKTFAQEPRCRFHREKRDKKTTIADLENDGLIRKAALDVEVGQTIQLQLMGETYFAGVVVENDKSQGSFLIDILPYSENRIVVDHKWLRLPGPSDFRLAKPSVNAIPLPKQSLNTSKRMANDTPRKGDVFSPGFKWEEFNESAAIKHSLAKVDLSKPNQLWFYLGKTSTEAKAQYTDDLAKPEHNTRANYLDSIPKPVHHPVPRPSLSASYPARVNQNALNAASIKSRPAVAASVANKREKPYVYNPRSGLSTSTTAYEVDQQAYRNQQTFLQNSSPQSAQRPALAYGSDPMKYSKPVDQQTSSIATHPPSQSQSNPRFEVASRILPPQLQYSNTAAKSSSASPGPNSTSNSVRQQSVGQVGGRIGRFAKAPDPFAKYPYLQKEHNRSPLDYKSPYRQGGGFLNGYEGNFLEHLRRNPSALMNAHTAAPKKEYPPILPPLSRSLPRPDATYRQSGSSGSKASYPELWGKKNSSDLHPAIRPQFHHSYQPTREQDQSPSSSGSSSITKNLSGPILPNPLQPRSKPQNGGAPNMFSASPVAYPAPHTPVVNHVEQRYQEYAPILPPNYQSRSSMSESGRDTFANTVQSHSAGIPHASYKPTTNSQPSSQSAYSSSAFASQSSPVSLSAYATGPAKPAYSPPPPTQNPYATAQHSRSPQQTDHHAQANEMSRATYGAQQHAYNNLTTQLQDQYPTRDPSHASPPAMTPFAQGYQSSQPRHQHANPTLAVYAHQQYMPKQPINGAAPYTHSQYDQHQHAQYQAHKDSFVDCQPDSMYMVEEIMVNLKKAASKHPHA